MPTSPSPSPAPPRRASNAEGPRRSSTAAGPRRSSALPRTSLAAPARDFVITTPDKPPSMNYDLRARKRSIFIFWFLILFDSIVMPLALYFGLWYGTNLSPNTVFSIVTAALGGISIFEYVARFWRLWKKGSNCRVIGGRRSYVRFWWYIADRRDADIYHSLTGFTGTSALLGSSSSLNSLCMSNQASCR